MKTIFIAMLALLLFPVSFAADAAAEPTVYEDAVLAIKFYDVSDLRKYNGDDKQLAKLGECLKKAKIKSGVVLINRIENITNNKYGMAKQFACVVKLGKKKISDHADVAAFTKTAKTGVEYDLEYYGFDSTGNGGYPGIQPMKFEIKLPAPAQ